MNIFNELKLYTEKQKNEFMKIVEEEKKDKMNTAKEYIEANTISEMNTENIFDEYEKEFEKPENKIADEFFNVLSKAYKVKKIECENKYPFRYSMNEITEENFLMHIYFYFDELKTYENFKQLTEEEQEEFEEENGGQIDFIIFEEITEHLENCSTFNPSAQNFYFIVDGERV